MKKSHWLVVLSSIVLFLLLYLGFDIKPGTYKEIEKQRALGSVSTDISVILQEAIKGLSPEKASSVAALEASLEKASDTARAGYYEELSALWYDFDRPDIAGHYAEEVAAIKGGEEAWSIAGTTYSICLQREKTEKIRAFCTEKAIAALEKAISVNPNELRHKVNLALVYAENPPKENPMKGVLMLVDMNKENPGQPVILTQLGRLALKTGQFEKAVERLEEAIRAEPDHLQANCLLAQAYEALGKTEAAPYQQKCNQLSGRPVE